MFQLATCPRCDTLQLHRDLDEVPARECRSCEERVPADDWQVREEHEGFEAARDRLRALRDRSREPGGSFSGGPPIPEARLPLSALDPGTAGDLADRLARWARDGDPVPEDRVVDALSELGAAHLLRHLQREGLLERVAGDEGAAYRVREEALPDP